MAIRAPDGANNICRPIFHLEYELWLSNESEGKFFSLAGVLTFEFNCAQLSIAVKKFDTMKSQVEADFKEKHRQRHKIPQH